MRVNRSTLILLAVALAVVFALAGWGHLLHLEPGALDAVRAAAAALGLLVLAAARAILSADKDRDGVPDALQAPKEPKR